MELLKIPPQAQEIEAAVLGALLIDSEAIHTASEILTAEMFFNERNRAIYEAMQAMYQAGRPIDLLTVITWLKQADKLHFAGGATYISELTDRIGSSANIGEHCLIISEKYIKRKMIEIANLITKDGYDDTTDCHDMLNTYIHMITRIEDSIKNSSIEHIKEVAIETGKQIREAIDRHGNSSIAGLPTFSPYIDDMTGGYIAGGVSVIAGRPGEGKCLGRGTKVVMYDGSLKNVEDIVVGDQLMGIDSTPRNVLSIARGVEQMYWVRQKKAMSYRVNESHILSLRRSKKEGKHKRGDVLNIPLTDYLKKEKTIGDRYKGYKMGFELPERKVRIDPYLLGLWLGDGSKAKAIIHNSKDVIREYIYEIAPKYGYRVNHKKTRTTTDIIVSGLMAELRAYGLYMNKHIPDDYLMNSSEVRLQLLAGLLDTDGYYYHNGYKILQKTKALAYQIKRLADGLGFRTNVIEKVKTIKKRNFTGTYYEVSINGHLEKIPCKVSYKKGCHSKKHLDFITTGITIEKDVVDEYFGFTIDGDRLFMLEDGTVTHNTASLLQSALNQLNKGYTVGIISLEMSKTLLTKRLVSNQAKINGYKLRDGNMTEAEYHEAMKVLGDLIKLNLYITDDVYISLKKMRSVIRKFILTHKCQIVYIDYLQLIESDERGKRGDEVNFTILRTLQKIAREFDVPIVLLSQLSRNNGNRPTIESLRGGGIEQAADLIIMLYDQNYLEAHNQTNVEMTAIVGKAKHGRTGDVAVVFNKEYQTIEDLGYTPKPVYKRMEEKKCGDIF